MALLNTNTRYLHDTVVEYAEALTATLPDRLSVCFFVNSGSEANELALRLARAYTGGSDVIVIDHAYHGHTSALIDISPYKFNGPGGRGKPDHVQVADMPDGYRGPCHGFDSDAGEYCARSVADKIGAIQARGGTLAAFFAEGIMGCGGQMPLPDEYLKRTYAMVRNAGGICVADEVQTGFGRVGNHFWSFELSGVVPDIVTMGKPIANGHPLGAVVTTPEIAAAFNNGMEYFNTFGGNPVSCAIGTEVLRIIADEGLQQNALETGQYWMERLRELSEPYPLIGQVRGSGLFLGIDLVRDRDSLEPADWEATYIAERMKAARDIGKHRRSLSQCAQAQAADHLPPRARRSVHGGPWGRAERHGPTRRVGPGRWLAHIKSTLRIFHLLRLLRLAVSLLICRKGDSIWSTTIFH